MRVPVPDRVHPSASEGVVANRIVQFRKIVRPIEGETATAETSHPLNLSISSFQSRIFFRKAITRSTSWYSWALSSFSLLRFSFNSKACSSSDSSSDKLPNWYMVVFIPAISSSTPPEHGGALTNRHFNLTKTLREFRLRLKKAMADKKIARLLDKIGRRMLLASCCNQKADS